MQGNGSLVHRLGTRTALTALLACLLCAAFAVTPAAFAASSVGSFEIDGNLKDDSGNAGEPIDWSTTPQPAGLSVTTFTDATGQGDDIFTGGSKELDPAGWVCGFGSAPAKDDLLAGAVAFRTFNGKQFVYARWRRLSNNGDAHIDYEFNQSTASNPSCPALPLRTVGDINITFDTDVDKKGTKIIIVRAFRWTGSTFTLLNVGSQGLTWDGAVNDPNDPTDPALTGAAPRTFGELALNLTDTIGVLACGQFASAYMKTRASTAINAALKDRTTKKPFNPGACPVSKLDKAVRNVTNSEAFTTTGPTTTTAKPGDTIEYRLTYTNTGDAAATNVVVTDPIAAGQTYVANSCTFTPTATGRNCSQTGTPGTVTWNLGTVAAGATVVMTFRVTIN
jgi:uncharacterized repeat protein (TIGR01451 family)